LCVSHRSAEVDSPLIMLRARPLPPLAAFRDSTQFAPKLTLSLSIAGTSKRQRGQGASEAGSRQKGKRQSREGAAFVGSMQWVSSDQWANPGEIHKLLRKYKTFNQPRKSASKKKEKKDANSFSSSSSSSLSSASLNSLSSKTKAKSGECGHDASPQREISGREKGATSPTTSLSGQSVLSSAATNEGEPHRRSRRKSHSPVESIGDSESGSSSTTVPNRRQSESEGRSSTSPDRKHDHAIQHDHAKPAGDASELQDSSMAPTMSMEGGETQNSVNLSGSSQSWGALGSADMPDGGHGTAVSSQLSFERMAAAIQQQQQQFHHSGLPGAGNQAAVQNNFNLIRNLLQQQQQQMLQQQAGVSFDSLSALLGGMREGRGAGVRPGIEPMLDMQSQQFDVSKECARLSELYGLMSSITGRGAAGPEFNQRVLHQTASLEGGFGGGMPGGYFQQSAMQQQQQPSLLDVYTLLASCAQRGIQQGRNGFGK